MLIIYSIHLGILYSTLQTENISDILKANTASQRTLKEKKIPLAFIQYLPSPNQYKVSEAILSGKSDTFAILHFASSQKEEIVYILLLSAPRQPGSSAHLCILGDNQDPSMLQHELFPAATCAQRVLSPQLEWLHLLNISSWVSALPAFTF